MSNFKDFKSYITQLYGGLLNDVKNNILGNYLNGNSILLCNNFIHYTYSKYQQKVV